MILYNDEDYHMVIVWLSLGIPGGSHMDRIPHLGVYLEASELVRLRDRPGLRRRLPDQARRILT